MDYTYIYIYCPSLLNIFNNRPSPNHYCPYHQAAYFGSLPYNVKYLNEMGTKNQLVKYKFIDIYIFKGKWRKYMNKNVQKQLKRQPKTKVNN